VLVFWKVREEQKDKRILRIIWLILRIVILGISFFFLCASIGYLINYLHPLFQEWGISKTQIPIILGLSLGGTALGGALVGANLLALLLQVPKPELAPGEWITTSLLSSRCLSKRTRLGGMLYITNRRIVFTSYSFEMDCFHTIQF
jgi:hypothetical protein